jgi:hypothetical protein
MFGTPVALMPVNNAYVRLGRMRSGGREIRPRAGYGMGAIVTTFLIANTLVLRLPRCTGRPWIKSYTCVCTAINLVAVDRGTSWRVIAQMRWQRRPHLC